MTEVEIAWKVGATGLYQKLALRTLSSMKEVEPLSLDEQERGRASAKSAELVSLDLKTSGK